MSPSTCLAWEGGGSWSCKPGTGGCGEAGMSRSPGGRQRQRRRQGPLLLAGKGQAPAAESAEVSRV